MSKGNKHPNRVTRFSKGKSGNPAGRKKGSEAQRHVWLKAFGEAVSAADMTAVAKRLVKAARKGESWAIQYLMDRCLGKPEQSTSLEVDGGIDLALKQMAAEETA